MDAKEITTASELIDALGGTGAVAEALGVNRSRVSMWRARNAVAGKWQLQVLALAESKGIDVSGLLSSLTTTSGVSDPDTGAPPQEAVAAS